MTYIEEYYQFLRENPDKACQKILSVYRKLVDDIKNPKEITFYNSITEEYETHRFVFDEKKGTKPIRFIEQFCRHSKGKWAGQPIKLELFQKAFIEALFGFVDEETESPRNCINCSSPSQQLQPGLELTPSTLKLSSFFNFIVCKNIWQQGNYASSPLL